MQNAVQRSIKVGLLCLLMSVGFGTTSFAQSGSAGGSIGNDEKSLSGSRTTPRAVETEKPARRSKPRPEPDEPRRASRKSGGGGGNFDGTWVAQSQGCGNSTERFVISGGRISGELSSGQVSSSGSTTSGGSVSGLSWSSSGRFSGRSGSGTFRRSDGCSGTWTASKQ
ncbi:hypothetical protein [Bradyrhizobium sp. OAE829]|uniref:hypothetical protein n=1 Tax=Bradyrhizobium sp. OAE829 TaxID=2663807 RepID=UPI00178B4891